MRKHANFVIQIRSRQKWKKLKSTEVKVWVIEFFKFFLNAVQLDAVRLLFYKHIFAITSENQFKVPDLVIVSERSYSKNERNIQFFSTWKIEQNIRLLK